ncbi:alpha/beta fold hydrolase [Runella sp.]|uniref:alpha/beta fold hydrolase n=1 Tax=Runella sp. TaxID=1960881 RepID=UPI003D12AE43
MKIFAYCFIVVLCCFSMYAKGQVGKTPAFGNNKSVGRYADIRGFKMYYEVYGKGKPLLMIHGNGGSIRDFANQIDYFSKSYKVIVPDSRAQGKSIDAGDSLSYEMMADDMNALLTALKLDSCDVIGWSDGGINGVLLAMRHPKKVRKLAITGTNLWPDTTALDPFTYQWIVDGYNDSKKKPVTAEVKNQSKLLGLMIFQPHITLKQLRAVQCPTLVIGGDHDVILPEHTLLIAKAIPKSYLWILPNSGHSTLVYYKDEFNETVRSFFRKPYRKIEGKERLN